MDQKDKEKLFGEIGVDLGIISRADVNAALEKQAAEEASGGKKLLGEYLLEANKITSEQVEEILRIQDMTVRSSPHIIENS